MKTGENLALKSFTTFGVAARAARVVEIDSPADLARCRFEPATDLVLGGGSNVLLASDIDGTVFLNRIRGMRAVEDRGQSVLVEARGGQLWHSLVLWSLREGLSGLENLSLIPGLVGAAPMQNIGAYGVELSEVLERVEAWDWQQGRMVEFSTAECGFAYRDSRFKSRDAGRFFITRIFLRLARHFTPRLDYDELREELGRSNIAAPDAHQVSRAVIMLRRRKLPDPTLLGNAGSFFKNPQVSAAEAESLRARFRDLPSFPANAATVKLSAAWLIEQCGWKGHREGDAGVSDRHALVLVNHGNASGAEILALAHRVRDSVLERTGVRLEPEARIYPETRT